jgi:hypothetical protein
MNVYSPNMVIIGFDPSPHCDVFEVPNFSPKFPEFSAERRRFFVAQHSFQLSLLHLGGGVVPEQNTRSPGGFRSWGRSGEHTRYKEQLTTI